MAFRHGVTIHHRDLRFNGESWLLCNPSEAVKKLKTDKIRCRKSLITNWRISWFGAFCQFFHSFSVTAGEVRRSADFSPQQRKRGMKAGEILGAVGGSRVAAD